MAAKAIFLVSVLAACNAGPVWLAGESYPGLTFRLGRSPSIAYGFGSGFSSDIGGIRHSSGIGASFNTGDGQAYGSGFGSTDGSNFASGVGYANAGQGQGIGIGNSESTRVYPAYNTYNNRNNFAVSSAQNLGNFGSVSTAQALSGNQFGNAVASAHSSPRYQTAISSAQNVRGFGYGPVISSANTGFGTAVSSAQNNGYSQSAISAAQNTGLGGYSTAISASENNRGLRASTAQAIQQRGNGFQQTGATSINGPGIQAAQSHAINTYY